MTTFQSINVGLVPKACRHEATTPTTPRALISLQPQTDSVAAPAAEESVPTTPTRSNYVGVDGQRPLPSSPLHSAFLPQPPPSTKPPPGTLTRGDSHTSTMSVDSLDVDMDESDGGEGNSDGESAEGDPGGSKKKKKGQRFFCTDYPPCNLSFTRSEHLARHIRYAAISGMKGARLMQVRKHTGERPFQCHCNRRFSRLDNLRQHAQTVHVNEEIPVDSLAATGARFQRHVRTDRVRTPNARSRASTVSSQGSHSRGHSRNLSTSSIGSTSSTVSRDDNRRRPQPLMMANESPAARSRLTLDTTRAQASTASVPCRQSRDSSDGISTPTSTTFSNGQMSPGYGSSFGSPASNVSRNSGFWSSRTHGRRLSVPSGPNPFQSPLAQNYPPAYLSPLAPSNSSTFSAGSSAYGSPTASTYGFSQREPANEADWRRRTWHPSTYPTYPRPATSGLSYYQTPDAPRPAFAHQAATAIGQQPRLPGIETFIQTSQRPATPLHRASSPMQVDTPSKPPIYPGPLEQSTSGPNDRRGHASWDKSLHQNLTKLDLSNGNPSKDASPWGPYTTSEMQDPAVKLPDHHERLPHPAASVVIHQDMQKMPTETTYLQPASPRKNKRHGWYNGPPTTLQRSDFHSRISPEDSSSSEGIHTPSFSATESYPAIVHPNGYIETHQMGLNAGQQVSTRLIHRAFCDQLID